MKTYHLFVLWILICGKSEKKKAERQIPTRERGKELEETIK